MENERRHQNPTKKGTVIAAALVLVAVAALFFVIQRQHPPTEMRDVEFTDTNFSLLYAFGAANFSAYGGGFFFAAGGGVRFFADGGIEEMDVHTNMQNPALYGRGGYAVMLEPHSTRVDVFNRHGEIHTINTQHPILSYSLGYNGGLTLITETSGGHTLYAFGQRGEQLAALDLTHDRRFPVASSISHCATRLAAAFIDISGTELNFVLFIYEISAEGVRVVASHADNHGQVPGWLRFLACGRLISISDRQIRTYAQNGSVLAEFAINNAIAQVSFAEDYFAAALCAGILNEPSKPDGTVLIFNSALNYTEFQADGANRIGVSAPIISRLAANEHGIIIVSGRELTALSPSGTPLWRQTVTHDIFRAVLLSEDTLLLAGNSEARIKHIRVIT